MIIIGEAYIEEEIAEERFSCDLAKCKGACCTIPGGRGAPLGDDEPARIKEVYPRIEKYLPPARREYIRRHGMVEGYPGSYATVCVGNRDCVFVVYEGDTARCAIEKAFVAGETEWRKPLSCHLFPIRAIGQEGTVLRYMPLEECSGGKDKGETENQPLTGYLREALIRKFGERWYSELEKKISPVDDSSGGESPGPKR